MCPKYPLTKCQPKNPIMQPRDPFFGKNDISLNPSHGKNMEKPCNIPSPGWTQQSLHVCTEHTARNRLKGHLSSDSHLGRAGRAIARSVAKWRLAFFPKGMRKPSKNQGSTVCHIMTCCALRCHWSWRLFKAPGGQKPRHLQQWVSFGVSKSIDLMWNSNVINHP